MKRHPDRARPNRLQRARCLLFATVLGAIGFASVGGTAQADPPWAHDGGPGWHGGPRWHGRPGWHRRDDDDWRGGYVGPRGYYPPPPPLYYAPPPPPPPPVYYAPPPPVYYGPHSLSFGINVPLNR